MKTNGSITFSLTKNAKIGESDTSRLNLSEEALKIFNGENCKATVKKLYSDVTMYEGISHI